MTSHSEKPRKAKTIKGNNTYENKINQEHNGSLSGRLCVTHHGCRNGVRAGHARRNTSRDVADANNSNRLRRSRDKELPVTNRIRGGRHRSGVERGDTAGPEDPWRRCLAP